MTDGEFWWRQIPGAARLVQRVAEAVCHHRIVVLHVPQHLPWADTFRHLVSIEVHRSEAARSLEFLDAGEVCPQDDGAQAGDALGDYLLHHFCKPDVRDGFRPALGYDGYLAACRDTTLGSSYLWFTGLSADVLEAWAAFLAHYYEHFQTEKRRQHIPGDGFACLLETAESGTFAKKGVVEIAAADDITSYDGYIYSFLRAGGLQISGTPEAVRWLRPCLAELARSLGGGDVEQSAALLGEGERLLEDPVAACRHVAAQGTYSDGSPFPPALLPDVLRRRVWTTQIRLIFPWLEEQRLALLDRHADEARALVASGGIENGNHEVITDGQLLEIGTICYHKNQFRFTERERRAIDLHRAARNDLAHLSPLSLAAMRELFAHPLA